RADVDPNAPATQAHHLRGGKAPITPRAEHDPFALVEAALVMETASHGFDDPTTELLCDEALGAQKRPLTRGAGFPTRTSRRTVRGNGQARGERCVATWLWATRRSPAPGCSRS